MQTATIDSAPGDSRVLAVQIRDAGLLDRRPGYYSVKIALTIAATRSAAIPTSVRASLSSPPAMGLVGNAEASRGYWSAGRPGFSSPSCSGLLSVW